MKNKKLIGLLLSIVMICAMANPASASEVIKTDESVSGLEIIPLGALYTVKDYQQTVYYEDGGFYISPWYYKELNVPNGKSISSYSESTTRYGGTYNGKKASRVITVKYYYSFYW